MRFGSNLRLMSRLASSLLSPPPVGLIHSERLTFIEKEPLDATNTLRFLPFRESLVATPDAHPVVWDIHTSRDWRVLNLILCQLASCWKLNIVSGLLYDVSNETLLLHTKHRCCVLNTFFIPTCNNCVSRSAQPGRKPMATEQIEDVDRGDVKRIETETQHVVYKPTLDVRESNDAWIKSNAEIDLEETA